VNQKIIEIASYLQQPQPSEAVAFVSQLQASQVQFSQVQVPPVVQAQVSSASWVFGVLFMLFGFTF
jgi:hypothetical protein